MNATNVVKLIQSDKIHETKAYAHLLLDRQALVKALSEDRHIQVVLDIPQIELEVTLEVMPAGMSSAYSAIVPKVDHSDRHLLAITLPPGNRDK